ncbi:MAG: GNAT family N-acetyltransferase [Veillonellales bacterium]
MNSKLIVRQALPADIDSLVELLQLLFAIETDFSVDRERQRCGLEMMLQAEKFRCVLAAEINRKVVGMCSAQLLVSTAEGGFKAMIEDVVVAEEYRGRGIGAQLLKSIAQWAAKQGATRLDLLADRGNGPALAFYKKLNWTFTELICLQKK